MALARGGRRAPRAGSSSRCGAWACSGAGSLASRSSRRAIALEHDALLGHREGGAEAAAGTAAEGDPLVGPGLAPEPALGPEGERLGVEVLAVVDEQDADADRAAGGHDVVAEAARARVTRRPMIGTTGRERIALVDRRLDLLARRPRSARTASRSRSWASGVRRSRSHAHASWLAVVSWPARTRVSSSSRSSLSVKRLALLGRAPRAAARGCRGAPRGRRRRGARR